MKTKRFTIVAFHNSDMDNQQHFFSTSHTQQLEVDKYKWIPVTYALPMLVTPRMELIDGIVRNKAEWTVIFAKDSIEVPNPDENFKVTDF